MEELTLTVPAEMAGQRLDQVATSLSGLSRTMVQKLIKDTMALVDGRAEKASYRLEGGEELTLTVPEAKELDAKPENIPLDVVYEDKDLIVINKAAGMAVHPAPGSPDGTLVNALLYHCKDLSGIGGMLRPGIVHRIDKDTTGLLVAAKNDKTHQALAEDIKEHKVKRVYLALVRGEIAEGTATIRARIDRSQNDRKKMTVVKTGGREAVTHFTVLERFRGMTLLECRLETGRTHQIRVHMQFIGHPIVGDPVYGKEKNDLGFTRQALHATELEFKHPTTGEVVTFHADPPADFQKALDTLHNRRG